MPTYPYLTQVVQGAERSRPDPPCPIYGARRTSNAQFRDRVARLADDFCLPAAEALRREVPGLRTLVYLGIGPVPEPMLGYEDLISAGPAAADAGRAGDDVAFVLYTGGTTGFLRSVMLSHANLLAATTGMLAAVHAVVVLRPDAPPASAQDPIGHCQARIAGYKCPRGIDFRDALPTSAAGKVLKTRLRADYPKQEAPH